MLRYFLVITIIFIFYIEFSVGGILIRLNSDGKKTFNFRSLFSYLINPLHSSFLWNIKCLDVNYIFVIFIFVLIYNIHIYYFKNDI